MPSEARRGLDGGSQSHSDHQCDDASDDRRHSLEPCHRLDRMRPSSTKRPNVIAVIQAIGELYKRGEFTMPMSVQPVLRFAMAEFQSFKVVRFSDVEVAADRFKTGNVIAVDVSETDLTTKRRVIDFTAGLAYGRDGILTKQDQDVYVLTPRN